MPIVSGLVEKSLSVLLVFALLGLGFLRCQELAAQRDAARAANATDEATITTLHRANQQNLAELAKLKTDYDRAAAAQAAADADAQRRAAILAQTERKITHAPTVDRGTVPRSLLHAIDGMLQPAVAATDDAGHPDRRGTPADTAVAP
jgi:hypothetical protein